jgi:hypothetical protein
LAVIGGPIYNFWMAGKQYVFLPQVFLVLLLITLFQSFWAISFMVPISVNKARSIGGLFTILQGVGMAGCYIVSQRAGLMGAAWFLCALEAVICLVVWRSAFQILEESPARFFGQMVKPPFDLVGRAFRKMAGGRAA